MDHQLSAQCKDSIKKGSKSFALASLIFDQQTQRAAHLLYSWCRYCDDQIDQATSCDEANLKYLHIREATLSSLRSSNHHHHAFRALEEITREYKIPHQYPLDLLQGMKMDLSQFRYQTFKDLELYCYRVAGTVGLMMSHIMGVSSEKALKHAVDLGMGMQLTNIARDIFDDYQLGRIYLPLELLKKYQLDENNLTSSNPDQRKSLVFAVDELLKKADHYYESGFQGLHYLPLRAAITIKMAGKIYASIGKKIKKRGGTAWDKRTFVPTWEKLFYALCSLTDLSGLIFQRIKSPWKSRKIKNVWRYE